MTGFGKSNTILNEKKISIEIRTLNSKSIELKTKIPIEYRGIENQIRKMLSSKLYRGKIDLNIYSESTKGNYQNILDIDRVRNYYQELKEINKKLGESSSDYLSMVLKMPDIYSQQEQSVSEEELKTVMTLLEKACDLTIKYREQEGKTIEIDFVNYISNIKTRIKEVERFENDRLEKERWEKENEVRRFLDEFGEARLIFSRTSTTSYYAFDNSQIQVIRIES